MEWFIKVVVDVGGLNDKLKCWIFEKSLRKTVCFEKSKDWKALEV